MNDLYKINILTKEYSDKKLKILGAPFLLRTFIFFIKEFPQHFSEIKNNNTYCEFILNSNKTKYKFFANKFSCNRYKINDNSKLFIKHNNKWKLACFDDFNTLFKVLNLNKNKKILNTKSQITKLKQQARYYIYISACTNLAKSKLHNIFSNENDLYKKIIFNHNCRNLTFLLMDCFGVANGHLDHPTPYPYTNSLETNLLGNDPFLSFLNIMDDVILLDDEKFTKNKNKLLSFLKNKKNINSINLVLLPKDLFDCDLHGELSKISLILLKTLKEYYRNNFSYNKVKYFLLPISSIEKKMIHELPEHKSLSRNINFLNYPLLAISTSSGRSMIIPISDSKNNNLLYLKTSWLDVKKTSINRGLSASKIEWFTICNNIFKNFNNKYFYYLSEKHYIPLNESNNHFAFLKRDYKPILNRKRNEFVLPLIGLVTPNNPFLGNKTIINYLSDLTNNKIFIKKLIKCITDTLIYQLLSKGVFHGLHLQNCFILFYKDGNSIVPKKVVIRDGDIRLCRDYLHMLSKNERNLINNLTKKRGKINSKSKFYKYFFHNIINENFGNIEQCLMESNDFDSAVFWKTVHKCFYKSIDENIKTLKKEGKFKKLHNNIASDFKRLVFNRSGFSANFFDMEYMDADEDFIKVSNPFKIHNII